MVVNPFGIVTLMLPCPRISGAVASRSFVGSLLLTVTVRSPAAGGMLTVAVARTSRSFPTLTAGMLNVPSEVDVPLKATACGLPAALLVRLSVAVRLPACCGAKVTLTVVCSLGATMMGRAAL